jgi:hypothetical protein
MRAVLRTFWPIAGGLLVAFGCSDNVNPEPWQLDGGGQVDAVDASIDTDGPTSNDSMDAEQCSGVPMVDALEPDSGCQDGLRICSDVGAFECVEQTWTERGSCCDVRVADIRTFLRQEPVSEVTIDQGSTDPATCTATGHAQFRFSGGVQNQGNRSAEVVCSFTRSWPSATEGPFLLSEVAELDGQSGPIDLMPSSDAETVVLAPGEVVSFTFRVDFSSNICPSAVGV